MVRGLILGTLAFGAVFVAERQFGGFTGGFIKDIKRYDMMRKMSGDGPFYREMLKSGTKMLSDFAASRQGGSGNMLRSMTGDFQRYVTMRSM